MYIVDAHVFYICLHVSMCMLVYSNHSTHVHSHQFSIFTCVFVPGFDIWPVVKHECVNM